MRRSRRGAVVPGEQFTMVSRLKKGETPSEILVREVMPLRRVTLRQLFTHKNRSRQVEVNLEITAREGGIQVTQTMDHTGAGLPWVFAGLIWLIHQIGHTQGVAPLVRLKALAENPS